MFPTKAGYRFCLALALILLSTQAVAQEKEPLSTAGESDDPAGRIGIVEPFLQGVRDEQGRLHLVPGLNPERLERLLAAERELESPGPSPPPYSITQLVLEGRADGDHAELQVTLSVVVVGDGWVRIPLRMGEASVRSPDEQAGRRPILERSEDDGLVWWTKGRDEAGSNDQGERELRLKLTVPLQSLAGEQVLVLTLPDTVPSELRLSVPLDDVVARAGEGTTVATQPTGDGRVTITAGGLGRRLELYWYRKLNAADDARPVLEATGLSVVDVDDEVIRVETTLQVTTIQGQLDRFRLHVPPGTEIPQDRSLTGARFERTPQPEGGSLLDVRLTEPAGSAPLQLNLITERPTPPLGQPVEIEGVSIVEAQRQTGQIVVRREGDWAVRPLRSSGVHRVDVSRLRVAVRDSNVLAAFEYARQPFDLALEMRRLEPHITVEPHYTLVVEADRVTLAATLEYSVERGGLLGVGLRVPSGWEVEEIGPAALVDPGEHAQAQQERLNVQFLVRTSDQFEVRLRAHRSLDSSSGQLTVPLPVTLEGDVLPVHLTVVAAANVDLSPRFDLMPTATPSVPTAPGEIEVPSGVTPFRRAPAFFRVGAENATFQADRSVRRQRIEVESETHVELGGVGADVEQTLSFDISYVPASEFALLVPEEIADSLVLSSATDSLAFLQRTGAAPRDGFVGFRAKLGQRRLGNVDLTFSYRTPFDAVRADAESNLIVWLVVPGDGGLKRNRVAIAVPSEVAIELHSEDWARATKSRSDGSRRPTDYDGVLFDSAGGTSRLNLLVRGRERLHSLPLVVWRAWIRASVAPGGSQSYRSHFRFATREPSLTVAMGVGFDPNSYRFRIDGDTVEPEQQSDGSLRIRLPAASADESRVLTVLARRPARRGSRGVRHSLVAPVAFADGASIERVYWQVHLPTNEYLVAGSRAFTEEWNWRRVGVSWVRRPRLSRAQLASWIGGSVAEEPADFAPAGNVYLFGHVGELRPLDFVITTPPILVLVASGTVFLLGVLPIYFRFARSAVLWLLLGTLFTLVGVVHPGPAVLFLQSAVLGASLVVVAGTIKAVLDRRHRGVVLATESTSGFSTLASTMTHAQRAAGSEGSTASGVAAKSHSESGVQS